MLSIENTMGEDWYSLTGAYCTSVEGTDEEWLQTVGALRAGKSLCFKRLAFAREEPDSVLAYGEFCSPRNSYGPGDSYSVSKDEALALADEIERVLSADGRPCVFTGRGYDPLVLGC